MDSHLPSDERELALQQRRLRHDRVRVIGLLVIVVVHSAAHVPSLRQDHSLGCAMSGSRNALTVPLHLSRCWSSFSVRRRRANPRWRSPWRSASTARSSAAIRLRSTVTSKLARPSRSPQQRALVPHYLLDVAEPDEPFTAGEYSRQARAAIADIAERGKLPIVVGGTGLYLRALLEGLFPGPERSEELRERLRARAAPRGSAYLHRILATTRSRSRREDSRQRRGQAHSRHRGLPGIALAHEPSCGSSADAILCAAIASCASD